MSAHPGDFHALAFRPAHARRILLEVAQRYARRRITEVATVRDAPPLSAADAVLLADYRFTLQQAIGGDELPQVPEPAWPICHRMQDWEGGDKFRKGAKKAPTWRAFAVKAAADAWAEAFIAQVFDAPQEERAALSDESRAKMLDALPDGAGGGS